ncbi:MAG: hypothetical protein J7M12_01855 [Candidatus Hydrogenedentes bacterium]|nr:hypothetical protein [Candidatus Hydrogenedentota bacterium]
MKQDLERLKEARNTLNAVVDKIESGNVECVATVVRQLTLCIQELLTVLHALAGKLEIEDD